MTYQELPSYDQPPAGALRFNTDSRKLEVYCGGPVGFGTTTITGAWYQIDSFTPDIATGGARGIIFSGYNGVSSTPGVQYINIESTGNAATFGTMGGSDRYSAQPMSDRTRGIISGGNLNAPNASTATDNISYVTISSTGNVQTFGTLTSLTFTTGMRTVAGNSTRGIYGGGNTTMQYVTIQSTGNGISFGDISLSEQTSSATCCSSSTRSLIVGGANPSGTNAISFFTTSTLGNTADFGDLVQVTWNAAACSNSVRGIFFNGSTPPAPNATGQNFIQYATIATLGDAVDFGDSTVTIRSRGACSSPTRAVAFGGADPATTVIDYVQIMSTGNAIDFGDLSEGNEGPSGCSNGHGGL